MLYSQFNFVKEIEAKMYDKVQKEEKQSIYIKRKTGDREQKR